MLVAIKISNSFQYIVAEHSTTTFQQFTTNLTFKYSTEVRKKKGKIKVHTHTQKKSKLQETYFVSSRQWRDKCLLGWRENDVFIGWTIWVIQLLWTK